MCNCNQRVQQKINLDCKFESFSESKNDYSEIKHKKTGKEDSLIQIVVKSSKNNQYQVTKQIDTVFNSTEHSTNNATKNESFLKESGNSTILFKHSPVQLLDFEKANLKKFFGEHFLFKNFPHRLIEENIISKISAYSVEENTSLFAEGDKSNCMYIIINGQCKLIKNGANKIITLGSISSFGELSLVDPGSLRTYSAKTSQKTVLITIQFHDYYALKKETEMLSYFKEEKENKNSLRKMLDCILLFHFLEDVEKDNFTYCSYFVHIKAGTTVSLDESFYIIKSGSLNCIGTRNLVEVQITGNSFYGVKNILNGVTSPMKFEAVEDSLLFAIPKNALIEILGVDFQYQIIFPYFKYCMAHSDFFGNLFNELQLVPVFELFQTKTYKKGSVVFEKGKRGKIVIILEGEIHYCSASGNVNFDLKMGQVCGDKLISYFLELDNDAKAKYNTIVIECEWEDLKKKITSFNSGIIKKLKRLNCCEMLKGSNESKLIEIASIMAKEKYKKGDIIMDKDSKDKKFYFVIKGETKLVHDGKTIRRYGPGNSCGEAFLLEFNSEKDEIIAASEKVILYSIERKYFMYMIRDDKFNDFIKHKICMEDRGIQIKDLQFVSKLSEKIALVKTSEDFYYAKVFYKNEENHRKLKNHLKAMKHLDYTFINRHVELINTEKYCILLANYLKDAVSLTDYIKYNEETGEYFKLININKNRNLIFYTVCIFLTIDYIHSKKIIHRSISTDNILIDETGYIKFNNFYTAKRLKSDGTSTLLEPNLFSAPEIILGEKHSFSSDYWSIGIVLYYLFFGRMPFDEMKDPMSLYQELMNKSITFINCDYKIKAMFNRLLYREPKGRICTLKEAKQLECLSGEDFDEYLMQRVVPPFVPKNKKISRNGTDNKKQKEMKFEEFLATLKDKNEIDKIYNDWTDLFL